ncbi:hypothetical protein Tco_0878723 [Tanacetum coccineum]|uniref:Uncharacterized protein n=1 Tax=Tanacetum coccineum TaxID=301880 RepID=A0ABQ5C108_9ASTR
MLSNASLVEGLLAHRVIRSVLHELIIEWLKTWSYELCWSWRGVEGAASWVFFSRIVWMLIEPADPDENEDYLREEELRLCLEGEEKMRSPAKRIQLCSSSEKIQPKVSWVKIKKYRQQVYDPCTAEFLKTVKPWVEDTSQILQVYGQQFVDDDIEFYRNFWLKLVCLDPARKGWLTEEHIDLWVDYMWHVRPKNSNWAMVSCYLFSALLQNGMPLFNANLGKVYHYIERECVRLLQKFQQDDLESSRGMMRLICETQLKVLKKLSFIALLRRQ